MISTDAQDRKLDRLMETRSRLVARWEGKLLLACDGTETISIQPSGFAVDSDGRPV